ncbi:tetratricopeptide repeat protein, partial [Nostoc sp. NIES-2111]
SEAVSDFNRAAELNPSDSKVYINRGVSRAALYDYSGAIEDYDNAIALDPNSAMAYYNRGNARLHIGDYVHAIDDYDKSIALDPYYKTAYINRGNAKVEVGNLVGSFSDYSIAIEIDHNCADAYANRARTLDELGRHVEALDDINMAIRIQPDRGDFYLYRALIKRSDFNYDEVIEDLYLAQRYDPNNFNIQFWIRELSAKSGHGDSFSLDDVDSLGHDGDDDIKNAILGLAECVAKILSHSRDYSCESVAHYTKTMVAHKLVVGKANVADLSEADSNNKLRYSNAVYMNDPDEGSVLFSYLKHHIGDDIIDELYAARSSNVYLGSFMPAPKSQTYTHEDDLIMWRTYGRGDNGEDAAGCSLVISGDFFDKHPEDAVYLMRDSKQIESIDHRLYKVLYYDAKRGSNRIFRNFDLNRMERESMDEVALNSDMEKLTEYVRLLIDMLKRTDDVRKISEIRNGLTGYLDRIRYLFKLSDYSFEKELRVIQYVFPDKSSSEIKLSDGSPPLRPYIESSKSVSPYLEKVILGPKVPNPRHWVYLELILKAQNPSHPIQVIPSACRYQ